MDVTQLLWELDTSVGMYTQNTIKQFSFQSLENIGSCTEVIFGAYRSLAIVFIMCRKKLTWF